MFVRAHTHTHTGYDEYTYLNPASVTLQLCPQIITYFVKIWLLMMHSIPLYGGTVVYLTVTIVRYLHSF